MRKQNKSSKFDKVSVSILSAFILLTGTHLGCRYDVGAMVDTFFQKVSAETVAPIPQTQDPIAAAPVVIPSNTAEAESIAQPNIARNPFLVPVAARQAPVVHAPANVSGSGVANVPAAAPASAPGPQVKGVVTSNGRSMAIVEYKGRSASYSVGSSIGDGYTVNGISGKTVSINGSNVNLGGRR